MTQPTYALKRFEYPISDVGRGNFISNQLTRFFAYNPKITVVGASVSWREGRSRTDALSFTLMYRGGGGPFRLWAETFSAAGPVTCEQFAQGFFDTNPGFIPVKTVLLSRPDVSPRTRKILVIFATAQNVQMPCLLNAPVGAPAAPVAAGAMGAFYDTLDLTRQGIAALNLGNGTWPAGASNLLIRALDANPDLCAWGGIAPVCSTGAAVTPPATILPTQYCDDCISPDNLTITTLSTTSTTTSFTTTTSSSTTTYGG